MDSRLLKPMRSPSLLKDHLLDGMSSCSSNGFKSFPRRQCCTTVRFVRKSKKKTACQSKSTLSALQTFITAVKRLPFGASKSPEKKKSNANSFLPRSFSRRIFGKGGFWKRKPEHEEIERWISSHQPLMEDPDPSDRSCISITTTDGSKSCSWSGSDFTASEGGNSSPERSLYLPDRVENDVVKLAVEGVSDVKGEDVTDDDVSAESTTGTNCSSETEKQWSSDQEKEHFSPVSVLDCPCDDDDDEDEDEVSSPFRHRLARVEGTRKELLKTIQKFESLAKLEPINLTRQFESHLDSDNESSETPLSHPDGEDDNEEDEEEQALELLDQMKVSMAFHILKLKADNLMLDFFKEGIAGEKQTFSEELVEMAKDWIGGQNPNMILTEWEVEKKRQAYVEDMEKGGEWKRLGQENEEVALELANEVFAALLKELLLDITT